MLKAFYKYLVYTSMSIAGEVRVYFCCQFLISAAVIVIVPFLTSLIKSINRIY